MADLVETMAYVESRGIPWHKKGTPADDLMVAADALQRGDLGWLVTKQPIFTHSGGGVQQVPGFVATVRDSDNSTLGIVRPKYSVFQNHEAFAFADNLVDSGDAKYDTVGSLRGGQVVFLSMELPRGVNIEADPNGELRPFILLTNGHNGLWAFRVCIVLIRTVCWNTLNMAIDSALATFTLKHTANFDGRLAMARETLGITFDYLDNFEAAATELAGKTLVEREVEAILKRLFPVPDDITAERFDQTNFARVFENWKSSPTIEGVRNTGWGLLNAVGESLDHQFEYRGGSRVEADDTRVEALLTGRAAQVKQRAFELISAA